MTRWGSVLFFGLVPDHNALENLPIGGQLFVSRRYVANGEHVCDRIDRLLIRDCARAVGRHHFAHISEELGNRLAFPFAQERRAGNRGRWRLVRLTGTI